MSAVADSPWGISYSGGVSMSRIIVRFAGEIGSVHMSSNYVGPDVRRISAGLTSSFGVFLDCFFGDVSVGVRKRLRPVDVRWEEDGEEFFYYCFGCVVLSEDGDVSGRLLLDSQSEGTLSKGYLRSILIDGEDFGYSFIRYFGCIDDAVRVLDMVRGGDVAGARAFVCGLPDNAADWAYRDEREGR